MKISEDSRLMKILISGASGFIGREIVAKAVEVGYFVSGFGRQQPPPASEKFEFYCADVTDTDSLKELEKLEDMDVVVHSAGLAHQFGDTSPEEFTAVNVAGTKNILDLAVKLEARHFILIGSTAVYGIQNAAENFVYTEETICQPQTFYAASKLEAEKVCQEICAANNMALTIFRLAPVIGEDNRGNMQRLIETIDAGKFVWIGSGDNLKSLIYKSDVADACLRVVKRKNKNFEIFNLAAQPLKMKKIVEIIAAALDKKIPAYKIPPAPLRLGLRINEIFPRIGKIRKIGETVEKWLSDDVYSAAKIEREYDFTPPTSIADGLQRQVRRYLANKQQ